VDAATVAGPAASHAAIIRSLLATGAGPDVVAKDWWVKIRDGAHGEIGRKPWG
jgi:hypothetical protein